jgi:phage portal protein BeeE
VGPFAARLMGLFGRAAADATAASSAAVATAASSNGGNGSGLSSTLPPWGNQWPYGGLWAGRNYSENLSVVLACVNAVSSAIASLPAAVYQRTPDGKRIERPDHPVARIIRQPNELQTWADFTEWLLASALLQGNAIAVVDHDGAGRPCGLYPVPWWATQAILIPVSGARSIGSPYVPNSRLVFDVTMTMMPWPLPVARPATGFPVRFFSDEVVFLRDRSDDGILGRSRISRCPEAIACGLGAQGFSAGVWSNGAVVNGTLQHPGKLSKEAGDRIAQSWRDTHAGGHNAGKVAILEEGLQYNQVGVSPEDAELLESRRFSVVDIARIFGVPPPIIGDFSNASFNNASSATEWFGSLTLLPWVTKIEREFSRVVFNDDSCTLSLDLSGMQRGDYASMMASNIAAVRSGIMSADEARVEANLDPRGGDADRLQAQAVGGRPGGTADGAGDALPAPGGNGLDRPAAGTA